MEDVLGECAAYCSEITKTKANPHQCRISVSGRDSEGALLYARLAFLISCLFLMKNWRWIEDPFMIFCVLIPPDRKKGNGIIDCNFFRVVKWAKDELEFRQFIQYSYSKQVFIKISKKYIMKFHSRKKFLFIKFPRFSWWSIEKLSQIV